MYCSSTTQTVYELYCYQYCGTALFHRTVQYNVQFSTKDGLIYGLPMPQYYTASIMYVCLYSYMYTICTAPVLHSLYNVQFSTIERLKRQYHEMFCFRFFRESSSPKPTKIALGSFRILSKIRGDIRK